VLARLLGQSSLCVALKPLVEPSRARAPQSSALAESRRHRGGVALRHTRNLGQTAGRVLELVLPHARAYAPLVFALFEPPQPTTVGIGTLAPADDSERIVKNVQFERNPNRIYRAASAAASLESSRRSLQVSNQLAARLPISVPA